MKRVRFIHAMLGGLTSLLPLASAGAITLHVASDASAFGTDQIIHSAAGDGIRDWHAESDSAIYIMDRTSRWYLATLTAPCPGLRFNNSIAFETDPLGDFDTFSTIRTRDYRCHVARIVRVPRPAAKGGKGTD